MPTTRKRTGATNATGTKKQKTNTGQKKSQPEVKVDEGFNEDGIGVAIAHCLIRF